MVSNVEGVNDFLDVLPYILKITCMGREVVCTLCNCAQYLLGNTDMQCVTTKRILYAYPAEEVVVLPLSGCPNDTYCHKTK